MNRITVYERADFKGLSREFTCDVPDLHELDFGDCIASLKVVGQPWIAYTDPKYEGELHAFEEGEYPSVETNLAYGYFNDRVASHVVQRGVWLLYQHPGRGGWHCLAWPGEHLADYKPELNFQARLSHLRPLRPGQPLVSARLLWEQKRVEEESFHFSNATSLKAGLSFTLTVEASNVFTVQKGRSESSTRRERVEVQLPAKIPPRTALSIQVLRKEVTLSVPVLLTITQNEAVRTETGEYRSISGT
ncbi:PREDICTED: epidermal differentiation-specific protein-like, partial [Tauraco erythrolophus]|uniref:epidermal differentiation-specific protein-like n=1 Tax=Tauraco erythrolophus TaxID=121530 RepID=UPI000523A0E0